MKYFSLLFIVITTSHAWEETILINKANNAYYCRITKDNIVRFKERLTKMCTTKKEDSNPSEEVSTWVSDIIQVFTDYYTSNKEVRLNYVEINIQDICRESPLSVDQPDQWTNDALETFCHFYTGQASFYHEELMREYIAEEYEL